VITLAEVRERRSALGDEQSMFFLVAPRIENSRDPCMRLMTESTP
jgi:hypothetical protein